MMARHPAGEVKFARQPSNRWHPTRIVERSVTFRRDSKLGSEFRCPQVNSLAAATQVQNLFATCAKSRTFTYTQFGFGEKVRFNCENLKRRYFQPAARW